MLDSVRSSTTVPAASGFEPEASRCTVTFVSTIVVVNVACRSVDVASVAPPSLKVKPSGKTMTTLPRTGMMLVVVKETTTSSLRPKMAVDEGVTAELGMRPARTLSPATFSIWSIRLAPPAVCVCTLYTVSTAKDGFVTPLMSSSTSAPTGVSIVPLRTMVSVEPVTATAMLGRPRPCASPLAARPSPRRRRRCRALLAGGEAITSTSPPLPRRRPSRRLPRLASH